MRGILRLRAEVLGRRHDARAEVRLPYAVHDHSAGQGIVRRGDPVSQLPASAFAGRDFVEGQRECGDAGSVCELSLDGGGSCLLGEQSPLLQKGGGGWEIPLWRGNLAGSAGQAQESAQSMANAWGFMGDHLESLYGNLDKGKSDNAMLRQIFLAAAEKSVAPILRDVDIIKGQMTAPQRRQDTGQRVGDMVVQEAQKQEEAARRAA